MGGGWWGERLEGGHTQCMAGHLQLGERLCSLARPLAVRVPQPRLPLLPQPRSFAQEVTVVVSPRSPGEGGALQLPVARHPVWLVVTF